jgi:hypothetical protein
MGSGERWSKKRVVESCTAIDTAKLRQWNLLVPGITDHPGALFWGREGEKEPTSSVSYTLTVRDGSGSFRLLYQLGEAKTSFDYRIRLVTTACHLGGVRWWFICPLVRSGVACERRVRKLYLCGKYFGCRHCHNLTYRSRQESDSRVYALARAGLDAIPRIEGASVTQLGLTLKALTLMQKRFKRPIV